MSNSSWEEGSSFFSLTRLPAAQRGDGTGEGETMKVYYLGRLLAAALLLLGVGAPLRAQQVEQGTTAITPWSGWWWPAQAGHLVLGYRGESGPLVKQDEVTGRHSVAWEDTHMYHFDPVGADWWGHCHAWAAASVLEPEPRHDVPMGGLIFHVGDIKGLLSEAHYSDRATFYGQRFNGNPGDDLEDMYPLMVWQVLRQYINQNKMPIVLDLNPGPQVWSYPVYKYQLTWQPIDAGSYQSAAAAALPLEKRPGASTPPYGTTYYQGQLSLWASTFEVNPDDLGTKAEQHNYTFVFQAQGSQLVANSDHWSGASVQDHPDFAWYPTQRVQENPDLDYNLASQLDLQAR
jgi:hypothetical protein